MAASQKGFYQRYIKRLLDIAGSLGALIVLSPVLAVVALLVRVKLGSPVLFRQQRPGLHEKIFTLYKFTSMTNERDDQGALLPNNMRHTPFGKFLRATSLDELPELYNILKGDMSLVGPRPLMTEYLPLYNDHQKRRHDVRPGLTGLAQVKGRNALAWEEKFDYDIQYVEQISFLLDIRIILQTIPSVLRRQNINQNEQISMVPFTGSEDPSPEDPAK
ncbi:MAG: sugar transferase [Bacillota bacterium]|nr:sugar transferase [Bacillota bacterium]MDW7678748.1 sugar transferase [Bacillota bacterium]